MMQIAFIKNWLEENNIILESNKINKFLSSRKRNIILAVAAALIVAIAVGCALYVNDYYHADETAID